MEQLLEFAIFGGKTVVVFLFIVGLILIVAALVAKQKLKPDLHIENLNEKFDDIEKMLKSVVMDKKDFKRHLKHEKSKDKSKKTDLEKKANLFLLKFDGDIKASAVDQLRDEISSVLLIAQPGDQAVILIESPGGTVHGYGLAAAQIIRLKDAGLNVIACVDKVAASGGYMMACTADKILAAPFAIIGSIGVLAQVPNFNRLLKKHDVDYEEITAGDYKRTLSLLGPISEKGRQKFTEQITDTHNLFKEFVASQRPSLDIQTVATGEYWFATRAKDLKLVDEIMTSDSYILKQKDTHKIFSLSYSAKKNLGQKIQDMVGKCISKGIETVIENSNPLRNI